MSIEDLVVGWVKSGLHKGDTLLIHTSLRRTLNELKTEGVSIKPGDVVDILLDILGEEGTLLLPLFNFDFTKGVPFDLRSTPSQMGAMTEAGRLHPDAIRTGHPVYSFASLGKHADRFAGVDNYSGYGADSPFAILHEMNGKIAVLDLPDLDSQTFYHHVEEMHEVPYRFHKQFSGSYADSEGNQSERTYSIFVRDINKKVLTHVDPAGELMWRQGLYSGDRPNEKTGLRVVAAAEMYDFVSGIIESDTAEGLLYRIGTGE